MEEKCEGYFFLEVKKREKICKGKLIYDLIFVKEVQIKE